MFIPLQDNTTPLYIACQNNNVEVVQVLLAAGAQADFADDVSACFILLSPSTKILCSLLTSFDTDMCDS